MKIFIIIANVTYGSEHPFRGAFRDMKRAEFALGKMLPKTAVRDEDAATIRYDINDADGDWQGYIEIIETEV